MRRWLSRAICLCLLLFFGNGADLAAQSGAPPEGVDFVNTPNFINRRLEFYFYLPRVIRNNPQQTYPLLVCLPGLEQKGQDFVTPALKEFAEQNGFAIVSPSFIYDQKDADALNSYQYPAAWSGKALFDIIEKMQAKYSLNTGKLYLYGFSLGAQYALRFALWRPELCAACVAHGNGAEISPTENIEVHFFLSLGAQDKSRQAATDIFYNYAKRFNIDVTYRQYPGGHELPAGQVSDSLAFIQDIKEWFYR